MRTSVAHQPRSHRSRSSPMREAVFVSYARTGLAKAGRGGFNMTPPCRWPRTPSSTPSTRRASSLRPSRTSLSATARTAPPTSVALRACWLASQYHRWQHHSAPLLVGSQLDRRRSQPHQARRRRRRSCWWRRVDHDARWGLESLGGSTRALTEQYPAIFMAMIETADIVAERYNAVA